MRETWVGPMVERAAHARYATSLLVAVSFLAPEPLARAELPLGDRAQRAAARGTCILKSAIIGANPTDSSIGCLRSALAALESAIREERQDPRPLARDRLEDSLRGLARCPDAPPISRVSDRPASASSDQKGTEAFVGVLEKELGPRGEAVARCYSELAKGPKSAPLATGAVVVELTIGSNGAARDIALVETSSVSPEILGCVVSSLCGIFTSAPPGNAPFSVELPFSFAPLGGTR